ncbi:hypothetical protein [Alkalisalibacterium limincola]|uniref:hypothetical protein n=1 Tax=Alkalisalibacterium limincola TaxID=2699169 RepID=UPI001C9CF009|nr:hypothetical protein [Alkalisalibacterium limincola]
MMKTPRRLRLILIAFVVVALLLVALWPTSRLVDTAVVGTGSVRHTVEAEGRTRLKDRFEITAPLAANARRLQMEPGDRIARGDVLVTLEPVHAPALDARTRRQAEAAVEAARGRLGAAGEQVRAADARAAQAIAEDQRSRPCWSGDWWPARWPSGPGPHAWPRSARPPAPGSSAHRAA